MGPVQQLPSPVAPPSPLSSRPELRRSVVERSAVSADLPWKCFSTREVMGRWPAQGDEKRFSSNYRRRKRRPPLLSSRPEVRRGLVERSAVSAVPSWECFSTERSAVEGAAVSSEQPLSTPSIQFAILSTTHGPTLVLPTEVQ